MATRVAIPEHEARHAYPRQLAQAGDAGKHRAGAGLREIPRSSAEKKGGGMTLALSALILPLRLIWFVAGIVFSKEVNA